MTPRQIELARHALGLPNAWLRSFRNYFRAGPGHQNHDDWMAMIASGDAVITSGDGRTAASVYLFNLTRQGALAALRPGECLDPEDWP
jgi:hypothetical protein